ncbi:MAG: hypothetical protein QXF35_04520 [Candidatus Bilamarchaeaceae archaeon]
MFDANKTMLLIVILIVLLAGAIFFVMDEKKERVEFDKGKKINKETFLDLLAESKKIYIVMDARNASSELVNRNIFQCGIDFAGSSGLVGRNVVYVGMDRNNKCVVASLLNLTNKTLNPNECIKMINSEGISIYINEGNQTEYYTRAAMVGIGDTYVLGSCSIGTKQG